MFSVLFNNFINMWFVCAFYCLIAHLTWCVFAGFMCGASSVASSLMIDFYIASQSNIVIATQKNTRLIRLWCLTDTVQKDVYAKFKNQKAAFTLMLWVKSSSVPNLELRVLYLCASWIFWFEKFKPARVLRVSLKAADILCLLS